ncbi:hypothetical protein EIP86_008860 [Pleurotus ostreatoroseus]|nr:hypothetical protein EIP86_008860 [Pleurotus ostreatoroseus]
MDIDEDLEPVRNELLNYGAEYAWLDVLCLRQKDSSAGRRMERLRKEEHKIDVPTIGYVYEGQQTIVTYYSGLGLPFRATSLDDERHWLNRAWTLQETHHNPLIGGLHDIQHLEEFRKHRRAENDDDDEEKGFFEALAREIAFVGNKFDVFAVLHRMRMRGADNELDKVCGIAYLLTTKNTLPTYDIDESPTNAWTRLVRSMDYRYRAELFFLYPSRGEDAAWMPSWAQTQGDDDLPYPGRTEIIPPAKEKSEYVTFRSERTGYRFAGLRIQACRVKGLVRPDKKCRNGTLVVNMKGDRVNIKVRAHHQEPIAETKDFRYDLLGTHDLRYWVVGRTRRDGTFRKVSVLRIEDEEALRTVEELDLAEKVSAVSLE